MRRRLRGVAFLAVLSQLLPYSQIARWAQAIVALGVATQGSRVYLGSVGRFRLLALRSALTVTLGIAVVTAGQRGWRTTQHRLQLSALPPSAAGSANVLLVILDTVREANLSLYGYARPTTPQLAERARDAVVFDRVFATAPWTLPSHATMMTGATLTICATTGATRRRAMVPRSPNCCAIAATSRGLRRQPALHVERVGNRARFHRLPRLSPVVATGDDAFAARAEPLSSAAGASALARGPQAHRAPFQLDAQRSPGRRADYRG
ncbi:MAG: sulfatase-like hydrolase/transferase [Gemmatimonadetes bacterium]|nr:sulfatase-like hydrolase/transferase [Gemmatimonadota bacterium]